MNILLINPPNENELFGNNPAIIESERGYNPPLGLLYIAGFLIENTSHQVTVIDSQVEELDYNLLEKRIKNLYFEVVGITAMTFTIIDVIKTIQIVKKINPDCRVVLGGPHVNIFPQETIIIDGVDFLVLGEGEFIFPKLIDNLNDYSRLAQFPGLVYKDEKGNILATGIPEFINNLDQLPFPARYLTPYKKYSSILAKRNPITTMITSRGCPYQCSFCNRPHLGKKFRAMSPQRVIEEFETCLNLGIREFLIYDDTFTIDKERVRRICRIIIEKKLDVGFDIRSRVDTLDRDLLLLLKRAGCRGIHYGIEAGTEKVLQVLKKRINLNQAKEIFDLTKKFKIQTLAYFMIGCPTETKEDILETFRIAKWLNPDFIHLTVFTPFPATDIYYEGLSKGIIKKDYWKEFAKRLNSDFSPPYWEEILKREELEKLVVEGYKSFYKRPSYIFKKITEVRSLSEFTQKAKAGLKIFFMNKMK